MDGEQRQPWEQQPGEPDAAYVRFLYYRNLGPSRSLAAAYQAALRSVEATPRAPQGAKRHHVPGQWKQDSSAHDWPARARAWDGHCLRQHGQKVVLIYLDTLERVALKANRAARRLRPATWKELLDAVALLGNLIAPETVEALAQQAREYKAPGLASPAGNPADDPGAGT